MTVITRDIINKGLTFTVYKTVNNSYTLNYFELIELIDRAKTYLIKERSAKMGDKVFICPCDMYIVWFFACAELGLSLLVSTSHEISSFKKIEELYGKIDHVIVLNDKYFKFVIDEYYNISIDPNVVLSYFDVDFKYLIHATDSTTLTISVSETNLKNNDLTIYNHQHEFYYYLLSRNGHILELKNEDRCMHNKILHHGSSLGTFFLPTIMYCKDHFWIPEHILWNEVIVKEQITRSLFMYYDVITFKLKFLSKKMNLSFLTIYTLRSPGQLEIDYYIKGCNASIVSMFGTTLSSGPVFLQTVNKDNYSLFDQSNFGKPIDHFYRLSLQDSKLIITTFDKRVIKTTDQFKIVDDNYYMV